MSCESNIESDYITYDCEELQIFYEESLRLQHLQCSHLVPNFRTHVLVPLAHESCLLVYK